MEISRSIIIQICKSIGKTGCMKESPFSGFKNNTFAI